MSDASASPRPCSDRRPGWIPERADAVPPWSWRAVPRPCRSDRSSLQLPTSVLHVSSLRVARAGAAPPPGVGAPDAGVPRPGLEDPLARDLDLGLASAKVRLDPRVRGGQLGGRPDRLDESGIRQDGGVVDEHRDGLTVPLDHRRRSVRGWVRQIEGPPSGVHEPVGLGHPVADLEGGVAERPSELVPDCHGSVRPSSTARSVTAARSHGRTRNPMASQSPLAESVASHPNSNTRSAGSSAPTAGRSLPRRGGDLGRSPPPGRCGGPTGGADRDPVPPRGGGDQRSGQGGRGAFAPPHRIQGRRRVADEGGGPHQPRAGPPVGVGEHETDERPPLPEEGTRRGPGP